MSIKYYILYIFSFLTLTAFILAPKQESHLRFIQTKGNSSSMSPNAEVHWDESAFCNKYMEILWWWI